MLTILDGTLYRTKPQRGGLFIHWMRGKYISQMLEIEASSTENFWGFADFESLIQQPNIQGYVVCNVQQVVGFIIYEFEEDQFTILNLGVHPDFRRKRIGMMLIDKIKSRMKRRKKLVMNVRESNFVTQLFLREAKFLATGIVRNFFEDYWDAESAPELENAYCFEYEKVN